MCRNWTAPGHDRRARIGLDETRTVLINASRGTVVDIDALATALEEKRILGCAVVYSRGPKATMTNLNRHYGHLITLLTPHIGGSTMEAQVNIGVEVAEKLVRYSDNGSTLTNGNFPGISPHPKHHRLLHVHENVPGVMSAINSVFAEAGINIGAQFLQTDEAIGYVVIDVSADSSEEAMDALGRRHASRCLFL